MSVLISNVRHRSRSSSLFDRSDYDITITCESDGKKVTFTTEKNATAVTSPIHPLK